MERLEARRRRQARELRRGQTPAEEALWARLRNRQILALKFRRQVPISNYIADFCCPELKLIVELDGEVHGTLEQINHDHNRDLYLKSRGYTVLRFSNETVLLDGRKVVAEITRAVGRLRPDLAS